MPAAVGAGAFGVFLLLYLLTPVLRSSEAAVAARVNPGVEAAKRALWQFSENEERLAVLVDALTRGGIVAAPDPNVAEIVAQNEKFLSEALRRVDEALATTSGDVTAANDLSANRLKGAILVNQGLFAHRKAQMLRSRADAVAGDLAARALRVESLRTQTDLVAKSNIEALLAKSEEDGRKLAAKRDELQIKIDQSQAAVNDMSARLARAQQTTDEARAVMERMEEAGADLSDPEGFHKFSAAYAAQAETYRNAVREAQELQFGTLSNARIGGTGDLLRADYVPAEGGAIEIRRGRDALQRDLEQLQAQSQVIAEGTEANRVNAQGLNELKARYAAAEQDASKQIAATQTEAKDSFDRLNQATAEACAAEDEALAKLGQAVAALRTAERSAIERGRVDTSSMSPEKAARSPEALIEKDRGLPAGLQFQSADALVLTGVVACDKFQHAMTRLELLERIRETLALAATDSEALGKRRDEAKETGLAAAGEAVQLLERASGPLRDHWTLPAQAAAARYLLVLFGETDAMNSVLANYEQAIGDRKGSARVAAYQDRLGVLQAKAAANP